MNENEQQQSHPRSGGRPVMRAEGVKRITLELPQELWEYITSVSPANRTRWLIDAAQEKREREQRP